MLGNIHSLGEITAKFLNNQGNDQKKTATVAKKATATVSTPTHTHPILTAQNYKDSIAKYNLHIKKYNMQVWMDNAKVRDYNARVRSFRIANKPTLDQRKEEFAWKEAHKAMPVEKYNEAVERYNRDGLWLNKKVERQEVKKETERVFIAILHQYNMQLFERKRLRMDLGIHINGEMPKVKLYPNKIVSMERNGCVSLPISEETFRHHRKRLEEAKVLLDYEFCGRKRPVKTTLNPQILTLTDNGKPKIAVAENQTVTGDIPKKVPHYNVSSRNSLDKSKVKGKIRNLAKSQMDNNCTGTSTGTPNVQEAKKNEQTGPPLKISSKNLLALIETPSDLSRGLSKGTHNNYKPLDNRMLEKEAMYGGMTQQDFKELAIQDIFCTAAVLFASLDVFPGAWHNAVKHWMQKQFVSPNGHTISKPIMLERWQNCLKTVESIKKFQKSNPDWNIPFPSQFFDPARKEKQHNSFEYAYRNFKKEKPAVETPQKRKLADYRTTRKNTDFEKARQKTRDYLKERISLQTLYDYVQNNCNREIYENINKIIKKEYKNFNR